MNCRCTVSLSIVLVIIGLLQFLWVEAVVARQDTIITGQVTDQPTGDVLPGVNIVIQGTQRGTSTDHEGRYQLEVPSLQGILIFTFIGYQRQEVAIDGRTTVDVQMIPQALTGEEVVVIGYGTQQRRQITGSVSSVKEEDFISGNVNSATDLIQGKVPGLQISNRSGNPNSTATIRLRGISSFGANQEPLVVIDGVIGASLENLDPNDIASIDVLKDASASAIYGTRGSAGVILITTKTGESRDGLSVGYHGYYTMEGIENRNEVLSAAEYIRLGEISGFDAPNHGYDTDWFKEITQTGSSQVHSLALSGGTENMNYRISGNFRDRNGIQKYTGFRQIGGRVNVTQWALDRNLKLTADLAVTNREQEFGFGDAFKFAGIMNPTAPVRAEGFENTGGYFEEDLFNYFNPVNIIEEGERTGEAKSFSGSLRAEYEFRDFIPNLSVSAFYAFQSNDEIRRNFYSRRHKMLGNATPAALGNGLAEQIYRDRSSELFETTVNYLTDIERLSFEGIAGYSYNEIVEEGNSISGGNFISDDIRFNNFEFAQDFARGQGSVGSFREARRIIGFFGRVNFNWDDTWFMNASVRQEGSSRFGTENKWGTFWSAGIGVDLANLADLPFFNALRVRGSIGKTGQDAPEHGVSIQRFAPQGNFFVNGEFVQNFGPVSNPNPDLKWEEKTEINIGVDFETMENRLRGSAEVYRSTTSDLIFLVGVPVPPNLFPQTWQNVGELETSGFELTLDFDAIQHSGSGLNWSTGLNFALFSETMLNKFATDEVQFLASPGSPGLGTPDLIRVKEGEPIGQIWGPKFAEIGSDGEWRFFDKDGNIVTFGELTPDDHQILGNGLPDFQLGWTNRINYRNLDFNIFIRGVFGHQLANMFSLFYQAPKQITSYNVLKSAFDIAHLNSDPRWSSFHVENADFIRFENVSLGYTFPLPEGSSIRRLRAYISGNNLLTLTGYSGVDPEVRHVDENEGLSETGRLGGALAPGIERRINWYTSRSFNVGIQLDF